MRPMVRKFASRSKRGDRIIADMPACDLCITLDYLSGNIPENRPYSQNFMKTPAMRSPRLPQSGGQKQAVLYQKINLFIYISAC
jgi:hypothetical protein